MAFQYLTEDMIKDLVPRVGRRAIFRHKYIEFKRRQDKNVSKKLAIVRFIDWGTTGGWLTA